MTSKALFWFSLILFGVAFLTLSYLVSYATSGFRDISTGTPTTLTVIEVHQTTTITAINTLAGPAPIPTAMLIIMATFVFAFASILLILGALSLNGIQGRGFRR